MTIGNILNEVKIQVLNPEDDLLPFKDAVEDITRLNKVDIGVKGVDIYFDGNIDEYRNQNVVYVIWTEAECDGQKCIPYIGYTKDIARRLFEHCQRGQNEALYDDIHKYGRLVCQVVAKMGGGKENFARFSERNFIRQTALKIIKEFDGESRAKELLYSSSPELKEAIGKRMYNIDISL